MDRPTPEDLLNDIFINRKCGLSGYGAKDDYDAFYGWCAGINNGTELTPVCEITGSELMKCNTTISFLPEGIQLSTYDKLNDQNIPSSLRYSCFCYNDIQPDKSLTWTPIDIPIDKNTFQTYSLSCYNAYYGITGLPWWIILLIIIACILAVSGAAYLFWNYYLRKKFGHKSTLESRFTSAPISTASNVESMRRRRSDSLNRHEPVSIYQVSKGNSRQGSQPSQQRAAKVRISSDPLVRRFSQGPSQSASRSSSRHTKRSTSSTSASGHNRADSNRSLPKEDAKSASKTVRRSTLTMTTTPEATVTRQSII